MGGGRRHGVHRQAALATSGSHPVAQSQSPRLAGKFQIPRTPGAIRTLAAQARHSGRYLRQAPPFTCDSAFPSGNNGPTDCILRSGLERAPDTLALGPGRTGGLAGGRPDSLLQVPTSSHQLSKVPSVVNSSSVRTGRPGGALPWGSAEGGRGASANLLGPGGVSSIGPQHVVRSM